MFLEILLPKSSNIFFAGADLILPRYGGDCDKLVARYGKLAACIIIQHCLPIIKASWNLRRIFLRFGDEWDTTGKGF